MDPRSAIEQLPHRYPFLLLDRVLMIDTGRWAVALKNVSQNEPLIDAHGEFPAALLAEVMAQTAGLAAAPSRDRAIPGVLVKVDRFRCRRPVVAGDRLVAVARVTRRLGLNVSVRACIRRGGRAWAGAELVLHFPRHGVSPEKSGA